MNQILRIYCVFLVMLCVIPASAQEENRQTLRRKLQREIERIAERHDGVLGVAIKDLATGDEILFQDKLTFPTGSSIKIPVLIELYRQAEAGKFKMTDQRPVTRRDQIGGSGVLQNLSDGGSSLSLADLGILMITLSDNTATNMLIDQVGMENVNRLLDAQGLTAIRLRRKMIDQAASARGDENIATPHEAMRLMEMLYRNAIGGQSISTPVLKTLKLGKSSPIPRLLPPSTEIANKPGGIEGVACDWGIVYLARRPYVIVVMTNYNGDGADDAIAQISKLTYDYFARLARSTPYGARVPINLLPNPKENR